MVDEGAILVGKTNAPSFAFRGTCDNKMFGATSTPFKVGYNSGLAPTGGSAPRWAMASCLWRKAPTDGGLDPYSRRMVRLLWLQGISWNHPRNREAERLLSHASLHMGRAAEPYG
mgnify:CR=1 FL=1